MKCTNCGKNEANFHYRYNVNGKVTESHLCADCAEKMEGKVDGFDWNEAFKSFDRMFDDMWGGFFRTPSLFGGFGMPVLEAPRARTLEAKSEAKAETETEAADDGLSRRRELNALKSELRHAVREENFERAIELRDRIRELEK